MEKYIFISYSHNDGDFADILIHNITSANFTVWIDSDQLKAGEDWRLDIDEAIKNAFALVVIMSPQAKASEYVTYEWSFAWGAGVKVIPVILTQTSLHPRLETLQHLDFTHRPSRPWGKLIEALKKAEDEYHPISHPAQSKISSEQIMQAAALLVEAVTKTHNPGADNNQPTNIERTKETAEKIDQLITPASSRQIARTSILWVDDIPDNNIYERQALEALGIRFTISTSTENALQLLSQQKYDLIISDMGRPPDRYAGYTLLEKIKERHISIPFIIYSGSKSREHVAEAHRRGAIGATNTPTELFDMVVNAIKGSK